MADEEAVKDQTLARRLLEHRDDLFAYIIALVRDWNVAEELFQEVSLVVLEKAQEGTAVEQFGPWAREIARRLVLNHWKTSSRSRQVLSSEVLESIDRAFARHDEADEGAGPELLGTLRECLKRLPEHLRHVVDLRYRDMLPLQDIAQRLNRTAGSVQVALSRIRARLLHCTKRLHARQGVSPA